MKLKIGKERTNVQRVLKGLKSNVEQPSIDEIDRTILRYLVQNARLSYRELARNMKISTTTVIERIKKLTKHGVIKGYSANVDSRKLGYELSAIIELITHKSQFLKTLEDIADIPNVYAIYHTTGDVDVIIFAKFRNVDELQKFLSSLYSKVSIERSETRIILSTVKEDFRFIV